MALIAEDIVFTLSEDVDLALPEAGLVLDESVSSWLVDAGLAESLDEADVGTWLSNMGQGALQFGGAGSAAGPWGALIGGLLGAGLGAAQTVASDRPASTPPAAAARPAAPTPAPSRAPAGTADTAAILNALREVLPALTAIAAQLNRKPGAEAVDGQWPDVAPDWSLERAWPYAGDGYAVEDAGAEQAEDAEAATGETVAEASPVETAAAEASAAPAEVASEESAEGVAASAEQLAPDGEAHAGAGLSALESQS